MKSKTNLKQFETYNIYNLLIPEYKIEDKKLDTVRILPRKKLRKCLKCGFKKRSCVLDPQNCTAMNNFGSISRVVAEEESIRIRGTTTHCLFLAVLFTTQWRPMMFYAVQWAKNKQTFLIVISSNSH